ncbi:sugar phosphate isomerase/epimerase family protein [Shouchella patagoniensis]|uniref:sugar phosphate isomerase/epimerase family protein n=1 Tax=Shouchella patagoniensis TaxID=228576 RepID=UPI0009949C3F|nr:sugar phosphate isomerase/epimerase [Shouchella patagoniensis]
MKLGVFAVLYGKKSLEEMLDHIQSKGLHTVEIGTGGYIGDAHCKPMELLQDEQKLSAFKQTFEQRNITISALSCHGNGLHPNPDVGDDHDRVFDATVELAAKLGVDTVVTFSGCPGESEHSKYPVWNTCPWPHDFSEMLKWQWEEKVIPYWRKKNELLRKHDIRVAIEPHPGFVVYNNETMLRLRQECGTQIGANFDPSHYFWQGMDPAICIRELGEAIYHFHAKDTKVERINAERNGVLDMKPYQDMENRSWVFRTVGYGHNEEVWRDIISALQLVGYKGAISIEHEDGLMTNEEGLNKAIAFLKDSIVENAAGEMWWA